MSKDTIKSVSVKPRVLTLSNGEVSNLGNWRDVSRLAFGEESPAYKFLIAKIEASELGEEELVRVSENEYIDVLADIHDGLVQA